MRSRRPGVALRRPEGLWTGATAGQAPCGTSGRRQRQTESHPPLDAAGPRLGWPVSGDRGRLARLADFADEVVESKVEHLRESGDGEKRRCRHRAPLDLADGLLGDACSGGDLTDRSGASRSAQRRAEQNSAGALLFGMCQTDHAGSVLPGGTVVPG